MSKIYVLRAQSKYPPYGIRMCVDKETMERVSRAYERKESISFKDVDGNYGGLNCANITAFSANVALE